MSDPFLGEIRMFAGNFAPRGWAFCQGQLLPINTYAALFALLGTQYGGNGTTTFGLPDLRGRAAIGFGQGLGLPLVTQGEQAGSPQVTLTSANMPPVPYAVPAQTVNVSIPVATVAADVVTPTSACVLTTPSDPSGSGTASSIYTEQAATSNLKPIPVTIPASSGVAGGGSQAFSVRNPYLGMNFIIALEGIFPSRN